MQPVSSITGGHLAALQRTDAAAAAKPPEPQDESRGAPAPAVQFVHEPVESPGQYWFEPGDQGPVAHFDPPTPPDTAATAEAESDQHEPSARPAEQPEPSAPEQNDAPRKPGEPELMRCSTDRVDKEIQAARDRAAALERQLSGATDDADRADIQRELDAARRELAQKDNDMYRKQHAQFTAL